MIVKDTPFTLFGIRVSNPNAPEQFQTVNLFPIPGQVTGKFAIVGGWYGERATAQQLSISEYREVVQKKAGYALSCGVIL